MKNRSFAIIEFCIALSMLLIVLAIMVPRFFNITRFALHQELELLNRAMEYVQHKAIASCTKQEVVFNIQESWYEYSGLSNKPTRHALNPRVQFGLLPNAKGPPSRPSTEIKTPVTFKKKTKNKDCLIATFLSDGNISSGTIYLVDKQSSMMVALTTPIQEWVCMKKYSYNQSKWICLS